MQYLVLIDGHSLAYRMYFALERTQMKTRSGFPTWGVYGFFKALFDLLKQVQPDGIAVAFDVSRITFRTEMYPEYKAHRKAMPDSLREQIEKIREGIELLGIPIFEVPNYEADDLIGTLARQAASEGVSVSILTGDQDALQVVDDETKISVLLPAFQGGLTRYDRQKVFDKLGVYPEQVPDFKGLKGDTSDNIPGVPGVGDKTAAKLLTTYQDLETVLAHTQEVSGNKLRESLVTYKDQALLSKDLATIRYDAPVTFSEEACQLKAHDINHFIQFLADMEFRSFLKDREKLLGLFEDPNSPSSPQQASLFSLASPVAAPDSPTKSDSVEVLMPYFRVPHQVVDSITQLETFLENVCKTNVMCIDIETSGLDVMQCEFAGIALSWSPSLTQTQRNAYNALGLKQFPKQFKVLEVDKSQLNQIETLYVPLRHADIKASFSQQEILDRLKPLLEDPNLVKIVHNGKFEKKVFRQHGIELKGLLFDTMVASYVLSPDRRHGLKYLAHEVLGVQMQEITDLIGKGKNQSTFTEVNVVDAAGYASCDTHATLQLAQHFIPQLDEELTALLYEVELPVVHVLADMEWNGVSLDVGYLKTLSHTIDEKISAVETEIFRLADCRFNLNSPKQVGEVLFEKLKIPARGMTPTKSGYTTNAKVLETLALEYPVVQKLLEYRQLFKLKSTYVDTLPQLINPVDHRIHTSFNQTVAATGRLSSTEPNLQNIPIRSDIGRSIRMGFVPQDPKEWSILSADYSQIELRLLAHFSEDAKLVEAFKRGEDIHTATASLVFEVPLAEVTKEMRYRAKAVNFGIIYGQTAFGLSNALKINPKEAAEFIAKYFSQYPSVKAYIEETKATVRDTGIAKTICGRRRDFSEGLNATTKAIREFSERAAFNLPLQGSAADLMKVAMIRLEDKLYAEKCRSKVILQVHDELVLEVYAPEKEQVKEWVLWAMTLEQPLKVPLEVDIADGPTWMEVV